jgi:general nucleoside transport system permease protein
VSGNRLRPFTTVAAPAAAVLLGLATLYLGLAASGYDAGLALGAMWRGAFGSSDAIVSAVLPRSVPLILIGLGLGVAFSAGALNIGGEGQFYAGAIVATWVGGHVAGLPGVLALPSVLLAAAVAGAATAAVAAALRLRFGVLEVITTLLLNFVAEAFVSWMVQGPLQERPGIYPQSEPVPVSARLPHLAGTRLHLGFALALGLAVVAWMVRRGTLWGLQLRATGLNPVAASVTGRVRVRRVFAQAMLLSGAMAGLAGGTEITGVSFALYQNLSPGYGFTAIAVALLARLEPLATVVTGLIFAALEAGATGMQREAGVPAVAVYVVEAVVIVVVLLADQARRSQLSTVPEALA